MWKLYIIVHTCTIELRYRQMLLLCCVEAVYNCTYMHYRVEIQSVVTVVLCGCCIQFCPRMLVKPCIVWQAEASCSQTFSVCPKMLVKPCIVWQAEASCSQTFSFLFVYDKCTCMFITDASLCKAAQPDVLEHNGLLAGCKPDVCTCMNICEVWM